MPHATTRNLHIARPAAYKACAGRGVAAFVVSCSGENLMNRIIRALVVPVVSLAVLAGCKHDKDAAKHMADPNLAVARMHPAKAASTQPSMGTTSGTITFRQSGDNVKIHAELTGLPPGEHGIHIHEKGDLSAADLSSAGGHYDPEMHHLHGGPGTNPMIHAGDLGNITADMSGKATLDLTVDDISLNGKNPIVGKSVIIHAKPDDFSSQPTGNSGPHRRRSD